MANSPRQRLVLSAITLMCERGVHATGLTDLLTHSKTARASIYQHFPDGKSELMTEATYAAGRTISAMLEDLLATRSPASAIAGMIDYWKQVLTGSRYTMGCPILAAAQAATEPEVQVASSAVFATWVDKIAAAIADQNRDPTRARAVASLAVSSIEGAIAQSRSAKSTQPLDDVHTVLTRLIAAETPPDPADRPTEHAP
ncbi:TetR/AcrR family transcriptional regulator [Actinokineospora xionganensis]|uniref:TetR/AcrR family transcriptional regulator n=1 Tax=Actinokineospora xionganensis TaxID=2684470 RepID=A0ABR7L7J3_9PSEU|nr:TetR/AcrR family transcriptional regulator [Actinokineospora xionganensis]MBC6448655.1 TetR/AcrR family transcriptional regulator [Actinokineospora xionganensis]